MRSSSHGKQKSWGGAIRRGLFAAASLASLLVLLLVLQLRLRVGTTPLWMDLIYASRGGGGCVMLKSFASLPMGDPTLLLLVERPWPTDQPLMWSCGDSMKRPVGPTRAGAVTFRSHSDFYLMRTAEWAGMTVGHWADGTVLYDTPGQRAHHFSEPMRGWSVAMPHWFAMVLTGVLPTLWVIGRVRRAQQPKGRVCPECTCDVPDDVEQCPDCHLVLGPAGGKGVGRGVGVAGVEAG